MYRDLQVRILRSPPFTDTPTLISTHHCMELLVSYIRHTVPPDEAGLRDDSWISSLLTISPFSRIVEFFSAEIGDGGSQLTQRRDFMRAFHNDLMTNENDDMNSLVYDNASNAHLHDSIRDIWFEVAEQVLIARKAIPHGIESVRVWNDLCILLGCSECRDSMGWHA